MYFQYLQTLIKTFYVEYFIIFSSFLTKAKNYKFIKTLKKTK